jgi:hypothetical protein
MKTHPDDYAEGETAMTPLAGDGLCHPCAKRLSLLATLQGGGVELDAESSAWLASVRAARDAIVAATRRAAR